jgi:sulfite exporter TauE/SafE
VHSHAKTPAHDHSHGALFGIGMLHGLAGTGVLVAALPLAIEGSKMSGLIYLAAFGVGTILSMALFAGVAGHLLTVTTAGRSGFQRAALGLAGSASVGVGLWWLASGGN